MDWWRNFRFAAGSVLNLSFHVKAADESMLRASQSKILLQHIRAESGHREVAAALQRCAKSNRMHCRKIRHIKYAIFRLSKPEDSASVAGKEHFRLLLGKSETA